MRCQNAMTTSLLRRLADDNPEDHEVDKFSLIDPWDWIMPEIQMLLSSRPRVPALENEPRIRTTVINYGVEEGFFSNQGDNTNHEILRQRIATTLQRFEPRLTEVEVTLLRAEEASARYLIQACCASQSLLITLIWDDAMSCFYLNK